MDNNQLIDNQVKELVLKAQQGDKEAFGKIYDIYVDNIYRYVSFKVPAAEAEDLLETIFLKAWENLHQYKEAKASFKSWLFRIAHNLVVDFYRLQRGVEELTEAYMDDRRERHPLYVTENVLNSEMLVKALKGLKKVYSQYVVLRFVNDLSNAEISVIMDKSEGSLRIIQFRALRALRKILEEMGFSSHDVTK